MAMVQAKKTSEDILWEVEKTLDYLKQHIKTKKEKLSKEFVKKYCNEIIEQIEQL